MLKCRRCGAEYEDDVVDKWGTDGVGDGFGPDVCCTQLIDDKRGRPDAQGNFPKQNCRGSLVTVETV